MTLCPRELAETCFHGEGGEEHSSCARDVRPALSRLRLSSDEPLLDQHGTHVDGWDLEKVQRVLGADPNARSVVVIGPRESTVSRWAATTAKVGVAFLGMAVLAVLFPVILPLLPFILLVPLVVMMGILIATRPDTASLPDHLSRSADVSAAGVGDEDEIEDHVREADQAA